MKATDLAKVLKEIVRREVRSVIREELKPILNEIRESRSNEPTGPRDLGFPKVSLGQGFDAGQPVINDVLAETAHDLRSGRSSGIEGGEEWPDISSMMTADSAASFASPSAYVNPNDPTNAFIKDYSAVLEKAEQLSNKK